MSSDSRRAWSMGIVLLALALVVYLLASGSFGRLLETLAAQLGRSTPRSSEQHQEVRNIETPSLVGWARGPIQVYFTRPHEVGREPQHGLDQTLATDIDRAKTSVDIATFDFDLPAVGAALYKAHQKGRRIRLVIDSENLQTPEVAALAGHLQEAGIPITFDRRSAFMHNKFVIVDGKVVWTGSWNLTWNDTFRNNNNMLRFEDQHVANDYIQKFEALFGGRAGHDVPIALQYPFVQMGSTRVAVAFAPDNDITSSVVSEIRAARQTIDVLAFTLTSDPIAAALLDARQRGVKVRAVLEARNMHTSGSEYKRLRDGGVNVLQDGNCYIMHDKVIVLDGRKVVTGSFNWTRQAQEQNDENALIVDDLWVAGLYSGEFQRIFEQALHPAGCSS